MSLPRYVSLLKNIRTLVFADPTLPLREAELKWTIKKHRYRSVGISPYLIEEFSEIVKEIFRKKPFVKLSHPLEETMQLPILLNEYKPKIPTYVFDTIILASSYVAPILILGIKSLEKMEALATWIMTSTVSLPEVEIRRNLRIVGYATLDFHEKMSSEAYTILNEVSRNVLAKKDVEASLKKLDKWIEKRKRLALRDGEHRFWRLKEKGEVKERPVIAYFDLAPLFAQVIHEVRKVNAHEIVSLIAKLSPNATVAFGTVTGFIFELTEQHRKYGEELTEETI
jgi:hypothetical protein